MTNSYSVNDHCIAPGQVFTVWNSTNVWVNSMKLVTLTTVPDILPFFQTELWNARNVFSCSNVHFGNRESKSRLGCGVSLLITWYIYMTLYPASEWLSSFLTAHQHIIGYFSIQQITILLPLSVRWEYSLIIWYTRSSSSLKLFTGCRLDIESENMMNLFSFLR